MNTKRNWTKVTVVVVLALASLSSMAMSAPHRDRLVVLADVCGVANVSQFDQYAAAIEWAEQGGTEVPFALTVSCVENSPNLSASLADLGGDSGVRWEQYMAAIEGRELELGATLASTVKGSPTRFEQYQAAIEWAEQGGPVPQALTVSGGENSPNLSASLADLGGDSGVRWEQYMAAIEGRELELGAAPAPAVTGVPSAFDQYTAAIEWAERGGQVPQALTVSSREENLNRSSSFAGYGGESWARFEQYTAAIEATERVLNTAPVRTVTQSPTPFDQYMAAIEWAERGGQVPQALTVSGGNDSPNSVTPFADDGGDSWARFEQYMAAIGR